MSTLSSYTVSGKLHEGSSTTILSGAERTSGAPVVIKIAKAEYPTPRDLARLRHEYLILRSLSVPGVVKAMGLERFGNGLALILEGIRGQALSTFVRTKQPDLPTVLQIGIALCDILHGLHECGVSHRDIKPQRVRPPERSLPCRSAARQRTHRFRGWVPSRSCGSKGARAGAGSGSDRDSPGLVSRSSQEGARR